VLAGAVGCGGDEPAHPPNEAGAGAAEAHEDVALPREWTLIDRATPELAGRFGPYDWRGCKSGSPCSATTWSPLQAAPSEELRPALTLIRVGNKMWHVDLEKRQWRARWTWLDPLLSACLGSALQGDVPGASVDKRLVEHEDGFWWTYDLAGVGPCDLRGGIELAATQDTGRLTQLTASGHKWGSPAAIGWSTDVLEAEHGGRRR